MKKKLDSIKKLLKRDVKEFNGFVLVFVSILILVISGLLSYLVTNSYALFSDSIKGEKTLGLAVSNSPTLVDGATFNQIVLEQQNVYSSNFSSIVFTDDVATSSFVDVSMAGDGSAVAWFDGNSTLYVSSQIEGVKVAGNEDCSYMFSELQYVNTIDFTNFDTSNVKNMSYMFSDAGFVASNDIQIDMSSLDFLNVTTM